MLNLVYLSEILHTVCKVCPTMEVYNTSTSMVRLTTHTTHTFTSYKVCYIKIVYCIRMLIFFLIFTNNRMFNLSWLLHQMCFSDTTIQIALYRPVNAWNICHRTLSNHLSINSNCTSISMFTKLRYSVTSHVFCQILSVSVNFEAMYIYKKKQGRWHMCFYIYIYE